MSEHIASGKLKGARGPMIIEWEIYDFQSMSEQANGHISSSMFFFNNSFWYLKVYPNGHKYAPSEGYVGVFLCRGDSGPHVNVTYSLFLKKAGGNQAVVNEVKMAFSTRDVEFGQGQAILRSELIESKSEWLPSDVLTVICSLKCDEGAGADPWTKSSELLEVSTQTQFQCCPEKLSCDLNELLLSGEDSDLTIWVKGVEFRLHSGIMRARTPVFGAMFRTERKKKATGIIWIDDCEAEVFQAFVKYLYSSSVDELTTGTVFDLFTLADKYRVEELKSVCLEFIQSTLSTDTFCDVVSLALTHNMRELLEQAINYFAGSMKDVLQSVKWMIFLTEHPIEANDLVLRAVEKKRLQNTQIFFC